MSLKLTLNPATDARYQRSDSTEWRGIYLIGDVHEFHKRVYQLRNMFSTSLNDLVVSVGDPVLKRPDSKAVLSLVGNTPNSYSIRENEEKLIDGHRSTSV